MSKALHRRYLAIATMVAILAMGVTPARADFEIWASTTGPPTAANLQASAPSGSPAQFTDLNFGGFSISVFAGDSNSPGTPSLATLTGTTLNIQNNNSGTATLWVTLGDTGFTQPTAGPLISSVGGTVVIGGAANALTYQSFVDPANGQNTTIGTTFGPQNPPITAVGSYNDTKTTSVAGLATYSMTETFKITLSGELNSSDPGTGSRINFSSSTRVEPIPEPSSFVLTALMGLAPLGVVALRRRRRRAVGV